MKDPLHWMPVKYKFPLTIALICLVSIGLSGGVAFYTTRSSLSTQILSNLKLMTQARVQNVSAYLDTLKRRTEDFASDGFIRDATRRIQEGGNSDLQRALNGHLLKNKVSIVEDFFETLVVGKNGFVLASSMPENVGADLSGEDYVREGKKGMYTGRVHGPLLDTGRASLEASAPLTDKETHHFLGVIVNRIDPQSLSQVVRNGYPPEARQMMDLKTEGGTRDWYLVNSNDLLLTATRFLDFETVFLKVKGWVRSLPPADDQQSRASGIRMSYRGKEVLAVSAKVPGTQWAMVSEMETSEVYYPITLVRQRLILVAIVVGTLTAILLLFPSKFLIGPILRLREAAGQIEKGDLGVSVEIESKDEIGQLAQAFNQMSTRLLARAQEVERYTKDLKDRENEVLYEKNLLIALVQCMSDGVTFIDARGITALHNSAAEQITHIDGYLELANEQNLFFKNGESATDDKDQKNKVGYGEQRTIQIDDHYYEDTYTPVYDDGGEYLGIVIVSRDITERKQIEERQRQQEKMTVIGELSAGIAHELNTPLASIAMFSQMLVEECPKESSFRNHAEVIMRNTQSCKKIIQGLLDYSAKSPAQKSEFDVNTCIKEVVNLCTPLLSLSEVSVGVKIDSKLPLYTGDQEQIRQVFTNLTMNSIQAMQDGGVLKIRTSFNKENERNAIFIDFTDSGKGVPYDQREKIFEPFFTTKPKGIGTGLGLSLSKKIIEAHGGKLELLNLQYDGGHFRITLPLVSQEESVEA